MQSWLKSVDCWLCTSKHLWDLLGFSFARQQSSFRQQQEELLTKSFLSSHVIWRASVQRSRQNKMLAAHVSANQNAVRVGTYVSHQVHVTPFMTWCHTTFSRKHWESFRLCTITWEVRTSAQCLWQLNQVFKTKTSSIPNPDKCFLYLNLTKK